MLPTEILVVAVLLVKFAFENIIEPSIILIYLTNLQGLLFINSRWFGKWIDTIESMDPLWFCTIIMICYGLIPVLQSVRKKLEGKDSSFLEYFFVLWFLSLGFC